MKLNIKKTVLSVVVASMLALPGVAFAQFHIATAMNFDACLDELIAIYTDEDQPGEGIIITKQGGQAGLLAGAIRNNSDLYQLFFSADVAIPQGLVNDSLAASPVEVYAKSNLVAYGGSNYNDQSALVTAITSSTDEIGICDPAHGPYGVLAETYLLNNNVAPSRIEYYQGLIPLKNAVENSSNATKIGFVTPSIVVQASGVSWQMPGNTNPQGACLVLQTGGAVNADADAFLDWIMNDVGARNKIAQYGFIITP